MILYHYYERDNGPFRSISDLQRQCERREGIPEPAVQL